MKKIEVTRNRYILETITIDISSTAIKSFRLVVFWVWGPIVNQDAIGAQNLYQSECPLNLKKKLFKFFIGRMNSDSREVETIWSSLWLMYCWNMKLYEIHFAGKQTGSTNKHMNIKYSGCMTIINRITFKTNAYTGAMAPAHEGDQCAGTGALDIAQ